MDSQGKESTLAISRIGDVTVVSFIQSRILDAVNIERISDELMALVEKTDRPKLILDFGYVEYLSSAVLGKLITLYKRVREHKGGVRLCGIRESILEIFKITRLNRVFEILPTQEAALSAFQNER